VGLSQLPDDLYETLVSVWRSRGAGPRGESGRLSPGEMYAVSRRIRELSRGFTGSRLLAGERYLSDSELLGAYLLHFWPASYCQAALCLRMIRRMAGDRPVTAALDVGAGPGPVSLALLDAGARGVVACDRSAGALDLAGRIASERGYAMSTRTWDAQSGTVMTSGSFDIISLGHILNELWAGHPDRINLRVSLVRLLGDLLAPGGRILVMEPALMQTAQEAIRVRDGLARAGFVVELPCIWQGNCPALPNGTCHGEFPWEPPREMVRLSHMARIGRETLKMAWFVLKKGDGGPGAAAQGTGAPDPGTPDGGTYRVVSEPLLSKSGRIRYLVCGALGRFPLSAPKGGDSPGLKHFYTLRRGEGITFTGAIRRETGWGLDENSRVLVVEPLPRPRS
jgi:SAM-dependent methyltransferase